MHAGLFWHTGHVGVSCHSGAGELPAWAPTAEPMYMGAVELGDALGTHPDRLAKLAREHSYFVHGTNLNQADARAFCQENYHNGDLAVAEDQAEWTAVNEWLIGLGDNEVRLALHPLFRMCALLFVNTWLQIGCSNCRNGKILNQLMDPLSGDCMLIALVFSLVMSSCGSG